MMRKAKKIWGKVMLWIVALFFGMLSSYLYSQKHILRFKHISIDDGLSQSSVYCILQDSKGFMWFGTQEGLNRYDGYKFETYKHDPQDITTISDNYVWTIYEDKEGFLWIGTYFGLNFFHRETGIFERYLQDKTNPNSLSHNDVRTIYEDQSGILWIGTYGGGLNKFDRKTGKFIYYKHDPQNLDSLNHNEVTSIYEDRFGVLWVGTKEGLNKFDRETENFKCFNHNANDTGSLSHNEVTTIYEDRFGVLWVGTKEGLNKFNREIGNFKCFNHIENDTGSLSHGDVTFIYEDSENILWIGTRGGGLNIFDRESETFSHYLHDASNPYSLSTDRVLTIYEDLSGVLWIGTRTGGLNTLVRRSRHFALYQHNAANPNSLSKNDVRAIYEDRLGFLWIGTLGGGLNVIDRKIGHFTHYKHDMSNSKSLSHNDIRVIYEDDGGILWIGTEGGGLNRFDRKTKHFVHYKNNPNNPNTLSHNDIRAIHEDNSGILWIGTLGGGLNSFNRERDIFKRYTYEKDNLYSLSDRIRCIYEDRSGELWIGTDGGLNSFDRNSNRFKRYHHDSGNNKSMSHNRVRCIHEDKFGVLWIGTRGGLNKCIDREKGYFQAFREEDGLPNNIIYGILEDINGNLWISTNNGLSRFNPKTGEFRNFYVDDGLQSNEFNAGAYFQNQRGEMFFGGINGFNSFFPYNIKDNLYVPPVVITDFLLFNQPVLLERNTVGSPLQKPIDETEVLTLNYNHNVFSFEFSALHYASPKKNQYKYILEGYDVDWIETDWRNRRATYTNLPGGDYVFRVIGSNKDGVWNEQGASINLKILNPPWETWWAYALYAMAVVAILFLVWSAWSKKFLRQKVEARTKELKETQSHLVQSEKMASLGTLLAGVAHEINNPTSVVNTGSYNLKKGMIDLKSFINGLFDDEKDKEILSSFDDKFNNLFKRMTNIYEGSKRISRIVKDLRTFSRVERKKMDRVKLLECLQITVNLVNPNYSSNVEFINDCQADLEIEGNPAELNQVFMNIIVNACYAILQKQKNTNDKTKGNITIHTKREMDYAVIIFEDTGVGIPNEVQRKMFDPFFTTKSVGDGTGLGLSISYDIIKKHGGRIEVTSKVNKGTCISVYLPLIKKT